MVGGLDIIPEIIKLIEPVREGRELHTTPVRNEMAYLKITNPFPPLLSHPPPLSVTFRLFPRPLNFLIDCERYYSCVAQLMLTQSLPLVSHRKMYLFTPFLLYLYLYFFTYLPSSNSHVICLKYTDMLLEIAIVCRQDGEQ